MMHINRIIIKAMVVSVIGLAALLSPPVARASEWQCCAPWDVCWFEDRIAYCYDECGGWVNGGRTPECDLNDVCWPGYYKLIDCHTY